MANKAFPIPTVPLVSPATQSPAQKRVERKHKAAIARSKRSAPRRYNPGAPK